MSVISHDEAMHQGQVFRVATLAGQLYANTFPDKIIRTREQREAQRESFAYMDAHPDAPETRMARFMSLNVANLDGAYNNSALRAADSLDEALPSFTREDVGAAVGIAISSYAHSMSTQVSPDEYNPGVYDRIANKMSGVVALLKGVDSSDALNAMRKDDAQYSTSYACHSHDIGPVNVFLPEPAPTKALRNTM